ncbi:MAG: acyl-CoA thioesterase domain-containing protein [Pseudomonadota bacterium]
MQAMTDNKASDFALDRATQLAPMGEGRYRATTDPSYWNLDSAFGGWVAAVMVAAVQSQAAYRGHVLSLNVQFLSPIKGSSVEAGVTLLQQRRRFDFWRVALYAEEADGPPVAVADLVAGERAVSDLAYTASAPVFRPVEECLRLERSAMTPSWFQHYEQYLAEGRPFDVNETPRSALYIREADGRPVDEKGLVALLDTPMPRTFFIAKQPRFAATLTMSTHLYASEAEMAETGSGLMRLEVTSSGIRNHACNQEARLYREDGLLLGTSYQTGIFR